MQSNQILRDLIKLLLQLFTIIYFKKIDKGLAKCNNEYRRIILAVLFLFLFIL